jgi:hypothetical protein
MGSKSEKINKVFFAQNVPFFSKKQKKMQHSMQSLRTASWRYTSARRNEICLVIQGKVLSDVEELVTWFEKNNTVLKKVYLYRDDCVFITCPQASFKSFTNGATWKYVTSRNKEIAIVIQGNIQQNVQESSVWFETNNKLLRKQERDDGTILLTFPRAGLSNDLATTSDETTSDEDENTANETPRAKHDVIPPQHLDTLWKFVSLQQDENSEHDVTILISGDDQELLLKNIMDTNEHIKLIENNSIGIFVTFDTNLPYKLPNIGHDIKMEVKESIGKLSDLLHDQVVMEVKQFRKMYNNFDLDTDFHTSEDILDKMKQCTDRIEKANLNLLYQQSLKVDAIKKKATEFCLWKQVK